MKTLSRSGQAMLASTALLTIFAAFASFVSLIQLTLR